MEEIEVPLEHAQEHIEHAAHGGNDGGHGPQPNWIQWAALLSAVLAVLAALSALNAGTYVNEAMIDQMKASDQWGYYQAKGIKSALTQGRIEAMQAADQKVPEALAQKVKKYEEDQKEIQAKAQEHQHESEFAMAKHEEFAHAVTFFQVAIALTAIAVLSKRRTFLFVSTASGLVGVFFLIKGLLH